MTVRADTLSTLEDKLARATRPDREIDILIGALMNFPHHEIDRIEVEHPPHRVWWKGDERFNYCGNWPNVSSSLDAAVALVERVRPKARWMVRRGWNDPVHCLVVAYVDDEDGDATVTVQSTPALALLLALIRSLKSQAAIDKG